MAGFLTPTRWSPRWPLLPVNPAPPAGRTQGNTRRLQIATRGFSPHARFPLDAPQRPPQSSQGYDLLLFFLAQRPGSLLYGRF